jgi:hypothetical protein
MRLPMVFPLLLAFLTLVSAKDWCFMGKCPVRNPDNTIPTKRSSYNVFVDARVNLPPNWRDNWRRNEADGPMFEDGPDVVHNDDGEEVRVRSSYKFFVEAKDKLPKLPDCFGKCPEEWYDGKEHPPVKRAECPVDCTRMHEMCVVEGNPGDQCLEMECGWSEDMVSHEFVRDEDEG